MCLAYVLCKYIHVYWLCVCVFVHSYTHMYTNKKCNSKMAFNGIGQWEAHDIHFHNIKGNLDCRIFKKTVRIMKFCSSNSICLMVCWFDVTPEVLCFHWCFNKPDQHCLIRQFACAMIFHIQCTWICIYIIDSF